MAETASTNYQVISEQFGDGLQISTASTDKIGAFGATPVAQQTAPTANATTAAVTSGGYMFADSTQAAAVIAAVPKLITALTNLGFIA